MTRQQLLDQVATTHTGYSHETVRQALEDHVRDGDGLLTRLQVGVYRLRRAEDAESRRTRTVRDWVLEALASLRARVGRPVTRREVEQELADMGLFYSPRSVNKGLTDLVRDQDSGVTRTPDQRYGLEVRPWDSNRGRPR